jgi:hypothetical protein
MQERSHKYACKEYNVETVERRETVQRRQPPLRLVQTNRRTFSFHGEPCDFNCKAFFRVLWPPTYVCIYVCLFYV